MTTQLLGIKELDYKFPKKNSVELLRIVHTLLLSKNYFKNALVVTTLVPLLHSCCSRLEDVEACIESLLSINYDVIFSVSGNFLTDKGKIAVSQFSDKKDVLDFFLKKN